MQRLGICFERNRRRRACCGGAAVGSPRSNRSRPGALTVTSPRANWRTCATHMVDRRRPTACTTKSIVGKPKRSLKAASRYCATEQ
jgi:hypothetical protein